MKQLHLVFLILLIGLCMCLSNCRKETDAQETIQNALLEAHYQGKAWRLRTFLRYNEMELKPFHWETPLTTSVNGITLGYGPSEKRFLARVTSSNPKIHLERKIEADINNCNYGDYLVNDISPVALYDGRNEPEAINDFIYLSIQNPNLSIYNQNMRYSKRKWMQGDIVSDSSHFYLEELIFLPNGEFEKYIFDDSADVVNCTPIKITGTWIFNTPFATTVTYNTYESEIILNYTTSTGANAESGRYTIKLNDLGDIDIYKSNATKSERKICDLRLVSFFSEYIEQVEYNETMNRYFGRVIKYIKNFCGFANTDDMIVLYDELFVEKILSSYNKSNYELTDRICSNTVTQPPPTGICPEFCDEYTPCGNRTSYITDVDEIQIGGSFISNCSVSADSSLFTVSNFANLGGILQINLSNYFWDMCHDFVGFTTTINGHTVNYQSIVSEAQNPVNSNNPCILINAIIDGNTRKIYMNY